MNKKYRWAALAATLLLVLVTATWVWAAPRLLTVEPPRTGTDPLSAAEAARARALVAQSDGALARLQAAGSVEILLVERHPESKAVRRQGNSPRRADFYSYNYAANTLTRTRVNLESGAVEQVETAQDVQLPLTAAETDRAVQLALADPAAGAAIEAAFRAATGLPLLLPAQQLDIHALIFRADAMPTAQLNRAAACGRHRCAQLLISTPTNFLINVVPVVDLSLGQVVNVGRFVER